jgi:hypothetical protein
MCEDRKQGKHGHAGVAVLPLLALWRHRRFRHALLPLWGCPGTGNRFFRLSHFARLANLPMNLLIPKPV